jgi:hypothetical protein
MNNLEEYVLYIRKVDLQTPAMATRDRALLQVGFIFVQIKKIEHR